jgi:2-haloalkanoic acid dehalogenase type II
MTTEVVLFDLDDTLIDYSGAVETCWDAACAHATSIGLDAAAVARVVHEVRRWFWSDPARHARERVDMLGAWTKIAAGALERLGHPSDVVARAIATDFATRRLTSTTLFDDALPCLEALRARGVSLGLVTNGDAGMQREKLARFALERFFDAIVIEGELGAGKPLPAIYHHVLRMLGARPEATLMVGDNVEWDVVGACQVGIAGIWLDRAGMGIPAGGPSVRVIRTLAELTGD